MIKKLIVIVSAVFVAGMIVYSGAASAQVKITCLTNAGHLKRQHEPLMKMFNSMQSNIVVSYAAPAKNYTDTHIRLLRGSATNNLPDCAFEGYHQMPALSGILKKRGQIVDLGPLMESEGSGWTAANYSDAMLKLGNIGGVQYGIPFNASLPQFAYNADLVEKAGGNRNNFPTDWDGVIDLAKKIAALDDKIIGMSYAVDYWGDDWAWQALILNQGGRMLNDAGNGVAFNEGGRHIEALKLLRRLVVEGVYNPNIDRATQYTAFTEGKMGIWLDSPAAARGTQERVGSKFELRTAPHPIWDDANGRLPTGGNAAVITTSDPEKIAAVWEYFKFITGPKGQENTALVTGYLPTNKRSLEPEFLGNFYIWNPLFATPSRQYHRAGLWSGYPGTQSVKIWRDQRNIIKKVMTGEVSPEEGGEQMVKIANKLMQK